MKIAFLCIGDRPHAKYMVDSFLKASPYIPIIQISDSETPKVEGVSEVVRIDHKFMMLSRMEGLASLPFDGCLIAVEDDIIIDEPFDDALEGDYDVAIVKRSARGRIGGRLHYLTTRFPYTTGFFIVKNYAFLVDCYENLLTMTLSKMEWWGDMACVKNVIETGKYKVRLLPENRYYIKPEKKGENGDAILWHYAGKRKTWMEYHRKGVLCNQ